ncbi:hypothetical protein IF1G_09481 [Cordyceps javanica]|uniref:Uncharacterized protein n=1 Tax=Cordyceps javanica TaxID=43265 RepID=A0A545UR14_9HYPO|nr:hypothetical protein IF1G_09481 [Cordyceps javanica]
MASPRRSGLNQHVLLVKGKGYGSPKSAATSRRIGHADGRTRRSEGQGPLSDARCGRTSADDPAPQWAACRKLTGLLRRLRRKAAKVRPVGGRGVFFLSLPGYARLLCASRRLGRRRWRPGPHEARGNACQGVAVGRGGDGRSGASQALAPMIGRAGKSRGVEKKKSKTG